MYHDSVIYLTRGYRGNVSDTHIEWRNATGGPYISSLVEYEGLLYMANGAGIATCMEVSTGQRVWPERLGGVYTASPVAADGRIYFASETGDMLVIEACATAEVLARNELRGHVLASPAFANGQIFIRFDRRLVAVGQ